MGNSVFERHNKENQALSIFHGESQIDSYYQLKAPFQLTLEFCSGISAEDYLNVITLSPDYAYFTPSSFEVLGSYFAERPLHRHSYYEIMIVLKGEVIQRLEGTRLYFSEGSCCILNRNLRHAEDFVGEAALLFIGLPQEFVKDLLFDKDKVFYEEEKLSVNNLLLDFFDTDETVTGEKAYLMFRPAGREGQSRAELYRVGEMLMQTMFFPKPGSTHIVKGLIGLLFYYLLDEEYFIGDHVVVDANPGFLLFLKISHLLEDTDGRITRQELEKELNYSGNYMNRIVKKYTEVSLFEYGMYFCMKKAAALLAESESAICDIAHDLGFTNRTHFYQWFRKLYGMTPKEFRQLRRKNKEEKLL